MAAIEERKEGENNCSFVKDDSDSEEELKVHDRSSETDRLDFSVSDSIIILC